jgi:serine/threonine-protein kinase
MADDCRVRQLLEEALDSGLGPEEVCRAAGATELLPQVRQRWQRLCLLQAQLGTIFPLPGPTAPAGQAASELPALPGYEVQTVLGRGGVGVVYRARHLRLQRIVALKMLLAGASATAEERERFLREARAVAGLRHPNIVGIFEVGEVDGRPYFTMEYVEGGSLAQKLAGAPQPALQAAVLVATLAGAMHAAHQAGIIHRDLKPANVLLAGDGTPRITDFGLARRLEGGGELTLSGVPMGTPGYMAPEQARGQKDVIGPATDVYALGAILYEMLTGRPPFRAQTAVATLQQVLAEGPVPPARLNSGVPRDLETVCLKCLRKQPEQRYGSARELADDLGRFLRGEPVAARRVGVAEAVRKWVWRRPAAAGLLAVVVLLVVAGGVGAWLLSQQRADARARQAQTDQEVRGALERARGLLEEGWQAGDLTKLTQARIEASRAEDIARSGGASAAVRQEAEAFQEDATERLERVEKDRALLEAMQDVSVPLETLASAHDTASWPLGLAQPGADEQYAAAFLRWGLDVDRTPEAEVVARLGTEPDAVVQELIAGLDGWMLERRRQKRPQAQWRRLFRVAERLDGSERRRRLRALLVGETPARAEGVAGLVGVRSPWPAPWELAHGNTWRTLLELRREIDLRTEPVLTVVLLASACAAVGDAAGAEQVLRQAVTARPEEAVLLGAMGKLLERQGRSRLAEAIGYYRAARSRRRHLGLALSRALVVAGKANEADEVLRELAPRQGHDPNPAFFYLLGATRMSQHRYREAEVAYREAIRLKPDWAEAHSNLGAALYRQQRYSQAEAACRKALDLRPDCPEAFTNLSNALVHQGKPGEAEAACRKALDLRPDYAEAYTNLGNALVHQGKRAEGEAAYRKALSLNPDLAEAHNNLGNSLLARKRYGEAEAAYRKAIDLRPDLAGAHNNLGAARLLQHSYGEAEASLRKAIDLEPNLAVAHRHLGVVLYRQRKYGEAEGACRRALALRPDHAAAFATLGGALYHQGKPGEAESACRRAIDLNPGLAEAHNNLGGALLVQQRYGEAEAAFRKATDLQPDLALAYRNLGLALLRQARFDEAAAPLTKAGDLLPATCPLREQVRQLERQRQRFVALGARLPAILEGTDKPASAVEQIELAGLCLFKKHHGAAARFFRDAFAADPKLAEMGRPSLRCSAARVAALAGCGQGRDAAKLDGKGRARWRRQALDWLRQDLAWWGRALGGDAQTHVRVRQEMQRWLTDSDLAGVRGKAALARLPDEERKQWERLWSDVDALLGRVRQHE